MFESFSSRANQSAVDKLIQLATGKKGPAPVEEERPAPERAEPIQEQAAAPVAVEPPPAAEATVEAPAESAPSAEAAPSEAPAPLEETPGIESPNGTGEPVQEKVVDARSFFAAMTEAPAEAATPAAAEEPVAVEEPAATEDPVVVEAAAVEPPPAEPVYEPVEAVAPPEPPAPPVETQPEAVPVPEPEPAAPVEAASPVVEEPVAVEPPPAEPVQEPVAVAAPVEPVVERAPEVVAEAAPPVETPAPAAPVSEPAVEVAASAEPKEEPVAAAEAAAGGAATVAAEEGEPTARAGGKEDEPFNLEKFRQRQAERRQRRGADIFPSPDETTYLRSRYRDSQRDEVTEEELKTLSRDPMWKTLVQFKGWLPVVTRVLPLLDLAGKRASSGNSEEIKDSVEGLLVSNRDMRTTLQNQTTELKRVEEEVARLREAADKNSFEQNAMGEDLRGIQRLMKNAFLYVGILLGLLIATVGYMAFLVFSYLNHPMH